jgi:Tfp pilus assembly protein PilF
MVAALRKTIQLNPSATRARIALAQSYLAADRLDAAISELEKAIATDPRNSNALYQLGLAYQRRGQTDKARRLFQAFEDAKSKSQDEENELVQILKTVKVH